QLDKEDLNQLWALVKEYISIRPATNDKEMELWVELKRMYEPYPDDQLWTLTHNFMHAPVEWKLYDLSGVHHLTAKDREIFMQVEKDYPLKKGLALVMISYKLQVENYSQMAEDLIRKIYNIANTLRQQGRETIEEGSGVGIIMANLEEKMYSYAIRLKFNASNHAMDCEALLAGLAVSVSKGMKDLHVSWIHQSWLLRQKETIRQQCSKRGKVLTGLATIKLEFLNQEVSVGIKRRPSVEGTSNNKKGKAIRNVPSAKVNYNWEVSGSN
nr:hypothetical protein [Tanacetum cinerariifolium]